jgi:hypothetical protein
MCLSRGDMYCSCIFLLQLGKLEVLQLDGNQLSHTVEDTPDTFKGKADPLSSVVRILRFLVLPDPQLIYGSGSFFQQAKK